MANPHDENRLAFNPVADQVRPDDYEFSTAAGD
jgi:hypothetical protein